MKVIKNFIERVEAIEMSFWQIFGVFATSIYLRTFFENFTNKNNQGFLNSLTDTFFHYPLWYAAVFISIILIFHIVTKTEIKKVATIVSVFSFVILLPPLIDIFVHGPIGHVYNFVVDSYRNLGQHFVTLLWSTDALGIGIKTEVSLALLGGACYIATKTKSWWRTILGVVLMYVSIFFFLSLPVHTMAVYQIFSSSNTEQITTESVGEFFFIDEQILSSRPAPTGGMSAEFEGNQEVFNRFSISVSIILLIFVLGIMKVLYYLYSKKKFWAVVKNARWERIVHYLIMGGFGMYVGSTLKRGFLAIGSLSDFLALIAFVIAILAAWLFAVWENDEEDLAIDQISNTNRPLVTNVFSKQEWKNLKWLFFAVALIAAWLGGAYTFMFITLFMLVYHIYSMKPLRLKTVPILSSVLIALNAAIIFVAGIFITAGTDNLLRLPYIYILGIFVIIFLAENIKNVKDIDGDKKSDIQTVPTMLGKQKGKRFTGILGGVAILLVPVFFFLTTVSMVTAVVFAVALYGVVTQKNYKEKYVFLVYFSYVVVLIIEFILLR